MSIRLPRQGRVKTAEGGVREVSAPGSRAHGASSVGGMERRTARFPATPRGERTGDRHWRGSVRYASWCTVAFFALTMLLDWGAGTLTPVRAGLWTGLAALVFAVLLPPRVTAGEGWLAVQGLVHERRVRTDALVEMRQYEGISAHLLLRDVSGDWVELDSRVLVANPLLWHEVDSGARRSRERGTLRSGTDVLRRLSERIDGTETKAVFRASGLE